MVYRQRKSSKEIRLRRKANKRFIDIACPAPFVAALTPIMFRKGDVAQIVYGVTNKMLDVFGQEIQEKIKRLDKVPELYYRHFGTRLRPSKISRTKQKKYFMQIQASERMKNDGLKTLGYAVKALGDNDVGIEKL